MVDNPEVIRQQMDETRSSLADKLETLESQVAETVQATTEAVTGTVEAVKETVENVTSTVQETVESVGQTLDLRGQVERHPWIILGGSVALGYLAAHLLGNSRPRWEQEPARTPERSPDWQSASSSERNSERTPEPAPQTTSAPASSANGEKSWFWEEVNRVKGLAVGALMGVVHDLVEKGLPGTLGQRVAQEVDHLTSNLGGETIRGLGETLQGLLGSSSEQEPARQENQPAREGSRSSR